MKKKKKMLLTDFFEKIKKFPKDKKRTTFLFYFYI